MRLQTHTLDLNYPYSVVIHNDQPFGNGVGWTVVDKFGTWWTRILAQIILGRRLMCS
jgi:hypothetical protein